MSPPGSYFIPICFLLLIRWKPSVAVIIVRHVKQNETFDRFQDAEALFGRRIEYNTPIVGRLYAAKPINGCVYEIPRPANDSKYALPFVCLLKRGNCTFEDKILAAERGGFVAAIVFNHLSDDIFPMSADTGSTINITAVMVGRSDGLDLLENFTFPKNDFFVEIYANHRRDIEWYVIPVLSVLGLFILGVVCVCLFRWHDRRRRRIRRCLTSRQLKRLPRTRFVKGETPDGSCVICLEDYNDGDRLRTLPCGHVYHARCIDPWLLKGRRVCPICKRHVFPMQRPRSSFLFRLRSGTNHSAVDVEDEEQLISESHSEADDSSESEEQHQSPSGSYGTFQTTCHSVSPATDHPTESTPLITSETLFASPRRSPSVSSSNATLACQQVYEPVSPATKSTSLAHSRSSSSDNHNGADTHHDDAPREEQLSSSSFSNTAGATPIYSTSEVKEQSEVARRGSNVSHTAVDVIVHRAPSPDNPSAQI